MSIVDDRGAGSTQGAKAAWFLENISAEMLLLLSMMADAGDEVCILLRQCDEGMDTAELLNHVGDFSHKLGYLFARDRPGVLESAGFTNFTIKHTLSKPVVWKVGGANGVIRSISLTNQELNDLKNRCLQRMQAWQLLAMATLQAEFPDFELCNAFCIFGLGGATPSGPDSNEVGGAAPLPCGLEMWCRKLAHAFGKDPALLQQELVYLRVVALRFKKQGFNNGEAWAQALGEYKKAPRDRDLSTLVFFLVRYRAYAISTCGLERKFSKQTWAWRTQSLHAKFEFARLKAKLLNDYVESEEQEVIGRAQKLWPELYKPVRCVLGPRFHKGRQLAKTGNSETSFLKDRRASVAEGARKRGQAEVAAVTAEELPFWGESHEEEVAYQSRKRRKIEIEAHQRGTLLPEEIDEDLDEDTKEREKKDADSLGKN